MARTIRVRDVARVELGAQDYSMNAYLDNKEAVAIGVFQRPGTNALAAADAPSSGRWRSRPRVSPGHRATASSTTRPSSSRSRSPRW
jgi:hypothetical protein